MHVITAIDNKHVRHNDIWQFIIHPVHLWAQISHMFSLTDFYCIIWTQNRNGLLYTRYRLHPVYYKIHKIDFHLHSIQYIDSIPDFIELCGSFYSQTY